MQQQQQQQQDMQQSARFALADGVTVRGRAEHLTMHSVTLMTSQCDAGPNIVGMLASSQHHLETVQSNSILDEKSQPSRGRRM
jgi:hypothetical protein